MLWLRDLAQCMAKTVILVTHATYHLDYCDTIFFLHQGRQVQSDRIRNCLIRIMPIQSPTSLRFIKLRTLYSAVETQPEPEVTIQSLKTAKPPRRFNSVSGRFYKNIFDYLARNETRYICNLTLVATFPA